MDSQKIIDQQLNILRLLYRFRFLTSTQISHLLKHNSIRITNYHLKYLSSNNYVGKHYSRSYGSAHDPAVYYLAHGSIKQLEDLEGIDKRALKRVYREKNRSKLFIAHASYIADYCLYLGKEAEKAGFTLRFLTKADLLVFPFVIHPLPDAYFVKTDKNGETKRYFVELVDDTSPRFVLRKRVEQYNDYLESDKFEEATGYQFPTILFICPGYASLIYLKKHVARIYEEMSLDETEIYLATREDACLGKWEAIEPDDV